MLRNAWHISAAIVLTVSILLLGYLLVRLVHQLAPAAAFALGTATVPLASALSVLYLMTRDPRPSTVQIAIYLVLSLPLLLAMLFVVGITRDGVQF